MPQRGLLLLLVGFVLLGAAWMFSTPPGWAPDEPAQYLRALGISEGQLLGPKEPLAASDVANLRAGGWRAAQQVWNDHDRRGVIVPASLSPPSEPCFGALSGGRCTEVSYTGDYYPLAYLIPAVGMSRAQTWETALLLSRAGSFLQLLVFLTLAVILTGPRPGWRLVGLLAATTPMVLFIGSMVNPNGLEIAANLAFVAALLRLRRDQAAFPGWGWISLIASGAVTILAWQLGPVFLAAELVVWAALMGTGGLRALYSTHAGAAFAAAGVLVAVLAVFVAWGGAAGVLHSTVTFASPITAMRGGLRQLGPALNGAVGNFGALNVPLPGLMIKGWWLAVIVLAAVGIWQGTQRERVALALASVLGLAFPVVFFAFSYRLSGFGVQGRYILPILSLAPMLAGDVIEGAGSRLTEVRRGSLWRLCVIAFAAFQLAAWWINAHHYAPSGLLAGPAPWTPPLGWRTWLFVAVLGALAIALAAAASRPSVLRRTRSSDRIGSIKLRTG